MKTIWKWELNTTDEQTITMPVGACPLTVQVQKGDPCLWALVSSEADSEEVRVWIFGTGLPADVTSEMLYVGTYQLHGGELVFHVFVEDMSL